MTLLLPSELISLSGRGSIIELVTVADSCVPVSCSAVLHIQDDERMADEEQACSVPRGEPVAERQVMHQATLLQPEDRRE